MISTGEFARRAGISEVRLHRWAHAQVLAPAQAAHGTGTHALWDPKDVGIAIRLREANDTVGGQMSYSLLRDIANGLRLCADVDTRISYWRGVVVHSGGCVDLTTMFEGRPTITTSRPYLFVPRPESNLKENT